MMGYSIVTTEREIDKRLVERVQQGGKMAFDLLVTKYQRKLFRLVLRLVSNQTEAEDVVQETFIKAYRALHQFRGDSAFYTWLYRIGINTAKNFLDNQGRRVPTSTDTTAEQVESFEEGENLRDINTPESMLASKLRKQSISRWTNCRKICGWRFRSGRWKDLVMMKLPSLWNVLSEQ